MASDSNSIESVQGFTGEVRLFPLPKLVMFPHVLQKLHIFEPRYRELLRDTLATDGLFALATQLPDCGCQKIVSSCPGIAATACLGRVVEHEPLGDGRANILFTGMARVRLLGERPTDKPYRIAHAELQVDDGGIGGEETARRLCNQLRTAIAEVASAAGLFTGTNCVNLTQTASLGIMTDVLAFTLPLDEWAKLDLLSEPKIVRRARLLLDILRNYHARAKVPASERVGIFPAKFSSN